MTEYALPIDNAGPAWHALDAFTQGFIEAAFFAETSCYAACAFFEPEAQERVREGQADGSIPSDAGPEDLHPGSLAAVTALCSRFQADNAALLAEAYARDYDAVQAGWDFYFTRAGHGAGYWDREQLRREHDDIPTLQAKMRAEGTTPAQWSALLAQVKALQGDLGERLSTAAGRHEISLDAHQDASAPSEFFVTVYL